MSQGFKQFQLKEFLLKGIADLRISNPTPIQIQAIPAILQGKDVIGQSHTGTGKTLAYVLPVLQQIDVSKPALQAMILAPTRELTRQIAEVITKIAGESGLEILLIQGGEDINRQIQRLKRSPQIIVGTPGRVLDLINRDKLITHPARFLIIDEADMMLDMGFREDIEKILQKLKRAIQIMLFSATLPEKVTGLAKSIMKKPLYIELNQGERAISAIESVLFKVRAGGKEEALLHLVREYNPFLGIVFVRKKEQVEGLVTKLCQAGYKAEGLQGDMQRGERKQVMRRFREAKSQILVATDLASRGLDIEGITHIFNFDPPINVDQYIHRIGRTGRAGDTGIAVNIVLASEEEKLRYIAGKLNQAFKEKVLEAGRIVDKPASRKENIKNTDKSKGIPQKKIPDSAGRTKVTKESRQGKGSFKANQAGEKRKRNDQPVGFSKRDSRKGKSGK